MVIVHDLTSNSQKLKPSEMNIEILGVKGLIVFSLSYKSLVYQPMYQKASTPRYQMHLPRTGSCENNSLDMRDPRPPQRSRSYDTDFRAPSAKVVCSFNITLSCDRRSSGTFLPIPSRFSRSPPLPPLCHSS